MKKKNNFTERLKEDWGKENIYGPWTKLEISNELKFYKSYWFLTPSKHIPFEIETINEKR